MSQITVLVDVELARVRFQFWRQVHVFGVNASAGSLVSGSTGKFKVSFDRSWGQVGRAKRHLLSAECSWFIAFLLSRRGFE